MAEWTASRGRLPLSSSARLTVGSVMPRSARDIGRIRSVTKRSAPECVGRVAGAAEPVNCASALWGRLGLAHSIWPIDDHGGQSVREQVQFRVDDAGQNGPLHQRDAGAVGSVP